MLRFPPWRREIARNTGKSPAGEVAVFLLKLDTDVPAMQERGRNQAAAGACERVKHHVARFGEGLMIGLRVSTDFSVGWPRLPE